MSTELDVVELELLGRRVEATRLARRGALAILLVPIAIVIGLSAGAWLDTITPMLFAAFYALFGGSVGVLWLGVGTYRAHQTSRQLREVTAARLPPARLLR